MRRGEAVVGSALLLGAEGDGDAAAAVRGRRRFRRRRRRGRRGEDRCWWRRHGARRGDGGAAGAAARVGRPCRRTCARETSWASRARARRRLAVGRSPRASQIFLEASLPCCRRPRTSSVSNSARETLLSLLSGNSSRCAFAQGWQTNVRKAMQATVGPRAAQSAHLRLPSFFKASLTARVLRSIVSWEGIARVFFWWSLGWSFDWRSPLTGARSSRVALAFRGCAAVMCASGAVSPSAWAGMNRDDHSCFFLSASVLEHARFSCVLAASAQAAPARTAVPDGLQRSTSALRQPQRRAALART